MPTSPAAAITAVRRRIADNATTKLLPDEEVDEAIQSAVAEYARHRPDQLTEDVTGDGTSFYPLDGGSAVLASWVEGFSVVRRVEYPAAAVSASHSPTFLDVDADVTIYRDATPLTYLWLTRHRPSATETVRVTYTSPRVLTASADTIEAEDKDALYALATSYALLILGSKMAGTTAKAIGANAVDYAGAQGRYKAMADAWRERYEAHMGLGGGGGGGAAPKTPTASSRFVDWDFSTRRGKRRLTH